MVRVLLVRVREQVEEEVWVEAKVEAGWAEIVLVGARGEIVFAPVAE